MAHDRNGDLVPVDGLRTSRFAVETGRSFEFVDPGDPSLRPMATNDSLIYGAVGNDLYTSPDGINWSLAASLPDYIRSLFFTQTGAALAAIAPEGAARLLRREPGGQDFAHVLDFDEGVAVEWNYAETNTHLFVSEYGSGNNKHQPNPRRIYRSADDGVTWELAYDPEFRDTHDHVLAWDAYSGRITQVTGDGPGNHLFIDSDDNGDTWQVTHHERYQPVSALARPEGIYWGLDGLEPAGVVRQVRGTSDWDLVLTVGRDFPPRDDQFDGNVFSLVEYQGHMLAPFANTTKGTKYNAGAIYASADGDHWTLSGRFGFDWGLNWCLGVCGDSLWMRYVQGQTVGLNNVLLSVGSPQAHRLVRGTRLEGVATNLWSTVEDSSAEGTLDNWSPFGGASAQIDTDVIWHGQQSVHVTCDAASSAGVTLPVYVGDLQAGTTVSALVQVYGAPKALVLKIIDAASTSVASTAFSHVSHRWSQAFCTGQLPADTGSLTVKLYQSPPTPGLDLHVDGIMLTTAAGGDTWQVGGQPRSPDICVYDFVFPQAWTDIFLWAPDPGADGPFAPTRILKVYEASDGRQLSIVYDPDDNVMRLTDSGDSNATAVTPLFLLAPHAVLRVAVVQSPTERTLYVRIAEDPYVGTVTAAPLQIARMYLGSDGTGLNAAGGLLARHQLFDGQANIEQIGQLFEDLISGPTPGDLDDDTDVDLTDLAGFQDCLAGPGIAFPSGCDSVDFDGDNDVDLRDFRSFELAFTGAL